MTKTLTRWAIAYTRRKSSGLYVGQWLTRADAISQHVTEKGLGPDEPLENRPTICHPYTPTEIDIGWRYWRKQGDRAVKIRISYET